MERGGRRGAWLGVLGLALGGMALGGCESLTPPASTMRLPCTTTADRYVLHTNSNRRLAYVTAREDNGEWRHVIVAEPPPDTAIESSGKLIAKVTASEGASGELTGELAQKIIDLTKRTQAIVILQDSLFRLELAYANGAIDREGWRDGFESVLDTARVIALADLLGEVNAGTDSAAQENASKAVASIARASELDKENQAIRAQTRAMALELLKVNPEVVERYHLLERP